MIIIEFNGAAGNMLSYSNPKPYIQPNSVIILLDTSIYRMSPDYHNYKNIVPNGVSKSIA